MCAAQRLCSAKLACGKYTQRVHQTMFTPDVMNRASVVLHRHRSLRGVFTPTTGIDTNGVQGADVATPPGAETEADPNGGITRHSPILAWSARAPCALKTDSQHSGAAVG